MNLLTEVFWAATAVVALVVVLWFWWRCVKAAVRELREYWHDTPPDLDTKHEHDQRLEDDWR